jgi:ribonuclease P protein component
VLRARPNELTHARLGIIAGRKAAARAVDRNRGKRLIREAFRAAAADLGPVDVAVQLKNDLRRESGADLRAELQALLEKLARRGPPAAARPNGQ